MKYYKALDKNMCALMGDGMHFRLGERYEVEGEIIPCKNGFHFCKELKDTWKFYNPLNSRFFEVEPGDVIIDANNGKSITNSITLIRELKNEEISKYIKDNIETLISDKNDDVRREVARQGYGLDILVNDKDCYVRYEVARHGYGLDILIDDVDNGVRAEVARQGYRLDILINDQNWYVRLEVARQGYGLDVLVNDENWAVRVEVANQGYGLDVLVNDEDEDVRYTVACQGYGLDVLVNDDDDDVRETAKKMVNRRTI